MHELLEKAVIALVQSERYYAEIMMLSNVEFTTEIRTLGINVTESINLYLNPHFWRSLSTLEQVDCLKHEFDHVLKNHFGRWEDIKPGIFDEHSESDFAQRLENNQLFQTLNIAGDYENNEYLPNLPKKIHYFEPDGSIVMDPETGLPATGQLCFVDDLKEKYPDIQNRQNLEYYYEFLKKEQEQGGGQGQDGQDNHTTLDDHSIWAKGNPNSEYVTEKIKQVVNKALESSKAAGHTPSNEILKNINALNYKPKDWRADLQRFQAKLTQTLSETSRKVRNRRYGLMYPGYRKKSELTLALGIDTSGSMYEELLFQIHAELKKIHNMGVKIWIIQCDTEVHEISEFDPKKQFEFKGRGGTAFKPMFDAAETLDIDGLIVFSDMDNFDVDGLVKPRYSVLWASPEGCEPRYSWGWRTTIKVTK